MSEDNQKRIQPIVILPPDKMSDEDVQRLRDNGICVVVCGDPDAVRFMEPPPGNYEAAELAAIELFRYVMQHNSSSCWERRQLAEIWAGILIRGTRLEKVATIKPVKRK